MMPYYCHFSVVLNMKLKACTKQKVVHVSKEPVDASESTRKEKQEKDEEKDTSGMSFFSLSTLLTPVLVLMSLENLQSLQFSALYYSTNRKIAGRYFQCNSLENILVLIVMLKITYK